MIGAKLKAKDLGHLRMADRDLHAKLLIAMADKISLPVEFRERGLAPFKVFVETVGRLPSMSPFIRRIHFMDKAFVKYAQAFTLDLDRPDIENDKLINWGRSKTFLEELASGTLDVTDHVDAAYFGFRRSKRLPFKQFPDDRQPYLHMLDQHVKEIANVLRNHFPRIDYVGTNLVIEQVQVLFCGNQEASRYPKDFNLLQSVDWNRVGEQDSRGFKFHENKCVLAHRMREVISATMQSYGATFMRPSFADLVFLEAALGNQRRLSKRLQRLSITTQQSYRATPNRLNGKALAEFLLRCTELTRLHLRINGDGSKTPGEFEIHDLIALLKNKNALPKLTHLRIDGSIYEEGELSALVQTRVNSLKFLFIQPSWLCYSPGNPSILAKDMNIATDLCMQPGHKLEAFYLGLLCYGFEQSIKGSNLDNVEKRMEVRRQVMATARLLPTEDKLGRVAKDLRIGEIYRYETQWGKEACEEKQSVGRQKVELKEYFERIEFS